MKITFNKRFTHVLTVQKHEALLGSGSRGTFQPPSGHASMRLRSKKEAVRVLEVKTPHSNLCNFLY